MEDAVRDGNAEIYVDYKERGILNAQEFFEALNQ